MSEQAAKNVATVSEKQYSVYLCVLWPLFWGLWGSRLVQYPDFSSSVGGPEPLPGFVVPLVTSKGVMKYEGLTGDLEV